MPNIYFGVAYYSLNFPNTRVYLNPVPSIYKLFHGEFPKPKVCCKYFLFELLYMLLKRERIFHCAREVKGSRVCAVLMCHLHWQCAPRGGGCPRRPCPHAPAQTCHAPCGCSATWTVQNTRLPFWPEWKLHSATIASSWKDVSHVSLL